MSFIEIIAVLFSFWCVYLSVKINKWSWPIGIVGVIAYMLVFFNATLYADFILQFVYLAQALYGWWYWIGGHEKIEPPITRLHGCNLFITLPLTISILTIFGWFILSTYTNDNYPFFDSMASSISLLANFLLARKKIESWILWIMADLIYISLFPFKDLYLSSILYCMFLIMAANGLIQWRKEFNKNECSN